MTLSEYSKSEIVRLLGVEPARIRVVFPAASANFSQRPAAEVDEVRRRYGLEQPFILFAGGFDRRKNLTGALDAFAIAAPRLPEGTVLAVSGSGSNGDAAQLLARTPAIADRVRLLGFVPDADFPALMSGCQVFFFPSLLEGFGLPALEAMSCGAAVVTSSTTSLPEVCGDSAVLADPTDAAEMAAALVRVCGDAALRQDLQRRGTERATQFSWKQAAEQTLDLYREVSSGRLVSAIRPQDAGKPALQPSR